MTFERELLLYEQDFKGQGFRGTKCQICTGCGRCVLFDGMPMRVGGEPSEERHKLHVVTANGLADSGVLVPSEPIPSPNGERLVTVDIGTTTIAAQLYDDKGNVATDYAGVNPQVRFGADVLSRIQAAEDQGTAEFMRREVLGELEKVTKCFRPFLQPNEAMRMVLAGNTTMIYLLMGYDPAELGRAPFDASHLAAVETVIGDVPCVSFPAISAFVGGDITAGMYACGMTERQELTLLVDLGTNGEMALGNRDRKIACATAAGPAFEGGVNRGVWGADMIHLLASLKREGVMDETGLLADEYFEDGILIGDVRVTQAAIRAIQLAKGAIGAGIRILMKEYGLGENWQAIDRVVLAGGFGYYLRPKDAVAVGILPSELEAKSLAGGNTALAGALRLGRELLAREAAEGRRISGDICERGYGADVAYENSGRSSKDICECGYGADVACENGGRPSEDICERGYGVDVAYENGWRLPEDLYESLGVGEVEVLNLAEYPDFEQMYVQYMNF
ncbi:MAG: ASKHA domain-containing protein [Butyrivibrio sp.]|nr:ASKHA domain-containing protein [Muribaculum sp.]MCM1553542.1 ASKHA domain-containing protein [Butyrivibrio sp.]